MLCCIVGIDLARTEEPSTLFLYLSGMYGWILDGISSLFEPVTGKNATGWPGKGNVSEEASTRPGVKVGSLKQESHIRPAKRNYQRSVVRIVVKYMRSHCGPDLHLIHALIYPCQLMLISLA